MWVTEGVDTRIPASWKRTLELPVTVDLEQQTIVCGNDIYHFTIDPAHRTRLLNGWDDIALTESYRDGIAAFRARDRMRRPWAIPSAKA